MPMRFITKLVKLNTGHSLLDQQDSGGLRFSNSSSTDLANKEPVTNSRKNLDTSNTISNPFSKLFGAAFFKHHSIWVDLGLIVIFSLGFFARTFDFGLYLDDYHHARPWNLSEVLGTFAGPFDPLGIEPVYFRPLTVVTFALDWNIWGFNSWGYHLTNVALHTGAALLLYLLLRRTALGWVCSLLGALFFLIIPLNAATAEYISERSDAMVAIFSLGGLLFLDKFGRSGKIRYLVGLNLLLVLAVCSKEIGTGLVLLALFYWPLRNWLKAPPMPLELKLTKFWQQWWLELKYTFQNTLGQGRWKNTLLVGIPPILVMGIYLIYRSNVLSIPGLGKSYDAQVSVLGGLAKAVYATLKEVPWEVPPWSLPLWMALIGLSLILRPHSRAWRYFFFGIGWIVVACVPLAPLGGIEPRLVYLPALGIAIVLAALVAIVMESIQVALVYRSQFLTLAATVLTVTVLLFLGMTVILEIRAQNEFSPFSDKVLYVDKKVYDKPDRYPAHAIQVIEAKLKQAGRIP